MQLRAWDYVRDTTRGSAVPNPTPWQWKQWILGSRDTFIVCDLLIVVVTNAASRYDTILELPVPRITSHWWILDTVCFHSSWSPDRWAYTHKFRLCVSAVTRNWHSMSRLLSMSPQKRSTREHTRQQGTENANAIGIRPKLFLRGTPIRFAGKCRLNERGNSYWPGSTPGNDSFPVSSTGSVINRDTDQ